MANTTNNILLNKTPSQLGYYMPAEWERHKAIWLAWPHDPVTFPNRLERVEEIYIQLIEAIHKTENVNLFVKDEGMNKKVMALLKNKDIDLEKISFHIFRYADVWIRDYGPIFLLNKSGKKLAMTHWIFDAWGKKYKKLMKDTEIPSIINQKLQITCFKPGIVLEGGSIDVNGKGTLLTTESCLLNKNRNSHISKNVIEKYLRNYLGVKHIIWLKNGIAGDDTDGHVDDVARFVNPTTILCCYEENENDENHKILKENYKILCQSRDQDGKRLQIIKLPMPGFIGDEKERLPASYANFYIGNHVVLVPIFRKKNDNQALEIIQNLFPDRKVIGINCVDLVYGLGAIHCISQQQPSTEV